MTGPIVFDGLVLADGPWTGVARAFLTGMQGWIASAPNLEAVLLLPRSIKPERLPPELASAIEHGGLTAVPHPLGPHGTHPPDARLPRSPWSRWRRDRNRCTELPRLLTDLDAAVLHSPVTAIPRSSPCPMIASVHDLPWVSADLAGVAGEPTSSWATRGAQTAVQRAIRNAAAILVPTKRTQQDLEQAFPEAEQGQTVRCIPHAVMPPQHPAHLSDLTGPFLVLGDPRRPRKNAPLLQEAWKQAKARDVSLPELLWLGPGTTQGFVSEVAKYEHLRRARALVHVSAFEGFGLPVVEAMTHGVPVLAALEPAITEVSAHAVHGVDPTSASSIASGLLRIHQDAALRQRLHRDGPDRASRFAPAHLAKAWQALHARVIAEANQ